MHERIYFGGKTFRPLKQLGRSVHWVVVIIKLLHIWGRKRKRNIRQSETLAKLFSVLLVWGDLKWGRLAGRVCGRDCSKMYPVSSRVGFKAVFVENFVREGEKGAISDSPFTFSISICGPSLYLKLLAIFRRSNHCLLIGTSFSIGRTKFLQGCIGWFVKVWEWAIT